MSWAWWLVAVTATYATQLPKDLQPLPGAVRIEKGSAYPITETIKVNYDLKPFTQIWETIQKHERELKLMEHQIENDGYISYQHKNMLRGITDTIRYKLNSVTGNNKTDQRDTHRSKRGLFDIVGIASHTLFGLVDDNTLQLKLQEYNDQLKSVTNTYNASARAINGLMKNVRKLDVAFQIMKNNTPSFDQLVGLNRFSQYAFLINQYQLALTDALYERHNLETALNQAVLGNIQQSLISPHDLRVVIRKLHLTQIKAPLFPVHNTTLFYATLKGYMTREGLVIIIPLRPKEKFTIYEIHPFPQRLNNSNSLVTLHATSVVLFSIRTRTVITPHMPLGNTCSTPAEDIFVCRKPTWNRDRNTKSCERSLVSNMDDIHKKCKFDPHSTSNVPFFLPTRHATLIYFYDPTPVSIICEKPKPLVILKGQFALPHECSMQTLHLNLPATHTYRTSFTKNVTTFQPTSFDVFPLHHIQDNITFTLDEMNDIPYYTNFISTHTLETFVYPTGITIVGMILCLGCVILFFMYVRRYYENLDSLPEYKQ